MQVSRQSLQYLSQGNLKAFLTLVSQEGLLIVRRQATWKKPKTTKEKPTSGSTQEKYVSDLSLAANQPFTWEEEEVRFDPSELNKKEFQELFVQFKGLVQNTRDGYRNSMTPSLTMKDVWGSRYLGPAAGGKIASNVWWYIYYTREHGRWKVWRMEYAIH
jgi:hypothetical protein